MDLLNYSDSGKVKLNWSLYFNWAPRREVVLGKWRYSSTHYLTSALDGGEWSALRPGSFTAKERAPFIHQIRSWLGPSSGLDPVVKKKVLSPCRDTNPQSSGL
jgi:hypothetical protein